MVLDNRYRISIIGLILIIIVVLLSVLLSGCNLSNYPYEKNISIGCFNDTYNINIKCDAKNYYYDYSYGCNNNTLNLTTTGNCKVLIK